MGGKDEMDATTSSKELTLNALTKVPNSKIGIIKEYMSNPGLDAEVKLHLDKTIEGLKNEGHEIVELSFPYLDYLVPTYYVLTTAEASSNLSRFDGVHYGHRSTEAKGVEQTYIKSRSEGFGPEVKRRIMTGTFVLSHGYYDAYYTKAQKVRRVLQDKTNEMLAQVDVLIMPTTPSTAFEKDAVKDPIQMYLQDIFTVHANLTGNPAISIPLAIHSNGLPFGLQLMTTHFAEQELFNFAKSIEKLKE
jgi:aspartyl-tRNA(Asn)/glutamyl-tRNA(Gln) amidotransferase subunit A